MSIVFHDEVKKLTPLEFLKKVMDENDFLRSSNSDLLRMCENCGKNAERLLTECYSLRVIISCLKLRLKEEGVEIKSLEGM